VNEPVFWSRKYLESGKHCYQLCTKVGASQLAVLNPSRLFPGCICYTLLVCVHLASDQTE